MIGSFPSVVAVAQAMKGYDKHWWFAGGWAIDLFLGHVTRKHADVEIAAMREHQVRLREHLRPKWSLRRQVEGKWVRWGGEQLDPPEFQLQAKHRRSERRKFDIFLEDRTGDRWICRRHPALTVEANKLTMTTQSDGLTLRFLKPEIQLLYKAKYHREKDESDFEAALPYLMDDQRRWLRESLVAVYHDDPWLKRL